MLRGEPRSTATGIRLAILRLEAAATPTPPPLRLSPSET
jgi:hypothetical protein